MVSDGWLKLSSHIHLPLSETKKRTTHREYLVWMQWFANQLNEPDRQDHYLMQIAAVIAGLFEKGQTIEKFKLKWGTKEQKQMSPEYAAYLSKVAMSVWCARLGVKPDGGKAPQFKSMKPEDIPNN